MNKSIRTLLLFSISLFLLFQSCSKEPEPSREQLLSTKHGWKEVSTSSGSPECVKDNVWIFKSNGYFNLEEGNTKCNSADSQVIAGGNWLFNSSKTIISLTISYDPTHLGLGSLEIVTLTKTNLVFKSGGNTYSFIAL